MSSQKTHFAPFKLNISVLLFETWVCFASQNFREMIPLLGVFRILAIVIFGTLSCVFFNPSDYLFKLFKNVELNTVFFL